MKGTRHSEEQIIAVLKQGEAGLATAELCRQHGITDLHAAGIRKSFEVWADAAASPNRHG